MKLLCDAKLTNELMMYRDIITVIIMIMIIITIIIILITTLASS